MTVELVELLRNVSLDDKVEISCKDMWQLSHDICTSEYILSGAYDTWNGKKRLELNQYDQISSCLSGCRMLLEEILRHQKKED